MQHCGTLTVPSSVQRHPACHLPHVPERPQKVVHSMSKMVAAGLPRRTHARVHRRRRRHGGPSRHQRMECASLSFCIHECPPACLRNQACNVATVNDFEPAYPRLEGSSCWSLLVLCCAAYSKDGRPMTAPRAIMRIPLTGGKVPILWVCDDRMDPVQWQWLPLATAWIPMGHKAVLGSRQQPVLACSPRTRTRCVPALTYCLVAHSRLPSHLPPPGNFCGTCLPALLCACSERSAGNVLVGAKCHRFHQLLMGG